MSQHESDAEFLREAERYGNSASDDRNTKVGALIRTRDGIRLFGANRFPRGVTVNADTRHARPAKYLWTEHAERDAVHLAARVGYALLGATIYVPWFPCADCTRAIIQSGISDLVAYQPDLTDKRWGESFTVAVDMLFETGVRVRYVERDSQ